MLYLNKGGSSKRCADEIINRRKIRTCCKSSVAKSHHDILLKGEVGIKGDFVTGPLDVGDGYRDGLLLAGGISQPELRAIRADVGLLIHRVSEIGREGKSLVLGLDGGYRAAVDCERRQNGQIDVGQRKRARPRNNKKLEGGKGKCSRDRCQEGRLRRDLFDEVTVEAILLALLSDDG